MSIYLQHDYVDGSDGKGKKDKKKKKKKDSDDEGGDKAEINETTVKKTENENEGSTLRQRKGAAVETVVTQSENVKGNDDEETKK